MITEEDLNINLEDIKALNDLKDKNGYANREDIIAEAERIFYHDKNDTVFWDLFMSDGKYDLNQIRAIKWFIKWWFF